MKEKLSKSDDLIKMARQAKYGCSAFATLCGISLRELQRKFLREYKCTPKGWLNDVRQHAGLELLRDGCDVKTAAAKLSYSRAENFSRDFKKHFGVPPSKVSLLFDTPVPVVVFTRKSIS